MKSEKPTSQVIGEKRKLAEDTKQSRKDKKIRKKAAKGNVDKDQFKRVYGEDARAELELKADELHKRNGIKLRDVQDLLLWAMSDYNKPILTTPPPTWVFLKNKPLIDSVVVVLADSLGEVVFERFKEAAPFLAALENSTLIKTPGHDVLHYSAVKELLTFHTKKKKKRDTSAQNGNSGDGADAGAACKDSSKEQADDGRNYCGDDFLLSTSQLAENGFYFSERQCEGYRMTLPHRSKRKTKDVPESKLLALDCEMVWNAVEELSRNTNIFMKCITDEGFELTRISIVNEKHETVHDTLVLPHNKITDYNTQYSGITAEMLDGVTTRLEDVQNTICGMVDEGTILVGHSLENDMNALKLMHDRIIDTSVLYPHNRGPPFKLGLKTLTFKFLKRIIQDSAAGHDSIVDAIACMELVQLKIQKGPLFGLPGTETMSESIFSVLTKMERQAALIDRAAIVDHYFKPSFTTAVFSTQHDESTVQRAESACRGGRNAFIWAHFYGLSQYLEQHHRATASASGMEESLSQLDSRLSRLYESLSPNTMFVCVGTAPGVAWSGAIGGDVNEPEDGEVEGEICDTNGEHESSRHAICWMTIKK